jgi:hypothetical protein
MTMDTGSFFFVIITAIIVIAISFVLDRVWAAAVPVRTLYYLLRLPGVVLHECAHIAGCLITGARIRDVVLFSKEGGSVMYSRPALPYIGNVIISTAPLIVLPLVLSLITRGFALYGGCIFPAFPGSFDSPQGMLVILEGIAGTIMTNLVTRFNGWFLLYLYLTVSLVLSVAPSTQDMKNAAAGILFMTLAAMLILWSGIPAALGILDALVRLLGYGFTLGLVFGLFSLVVSLPLMVWYVYLRIG